MPECRSRRGRDRIMLVGFITTVPMQSVPTMYHHYH